MVGTEPAAPMPVDAARVKGSRVLIVRSPYYQAIAQSLTRGATEVLEKHGIGYDIVDVPGALEIPTALAIALDAAAAKKKPYDGAVALGCVIRGDTIHFEIVSEQSARGVMDVSIARKIPIGNGILTVNNEGQANVRAGLDEGDKGGEAARAMLTLVRLRRAVSKK